MRDLLVACELRESLRKELCGWLVGEIANLICAVVSYEERTHILSSVQLWSGLVLPLGRGPCVVISWMRDIRFLAGREGCQGTIGKKWDDGLTFVVTHFTPVRCVDRSHHRHHHFQIKVMVACARNG